MFDKNKFGYHNEEHMSKLIVEQPVTVFKYMGRVFICVTANTDQLQ